MYEGPEGHSDLAPGVGDGGGGDAVFALGVWGAEKAFSGPMKEQGRCPGRERSTRKGPEAERTWGRREAAYG